MQSDQKVGLALGVLLIGTVAAFFFRNETTTSRAVPGLERASEVNREVAEKRLTPYLPSTSEADLSPVLVARKAATELEEELTAGERRLPTWNELQAEIDDPFTAESNPDQVPAPAPDPIPMEKFQTPQPDELTAAAPPSVATPPGSEPLPRSSTHVVQRGDTLSSIAGKYLGSQARFQEVFDANRDLLRDANDLKIGMKLRIPDGTSPTVVRKTSVTATNLLTRQAKSDEAGEPIPATTPLDTTSEPVASSVREEEPSVTVEDVPLAEKSKPLDPPKIKFKPAKRRPLQSSP